MKLLLALTFASLLAACHTSQPAPGPASPAPTTSTEPAGSGSGSASTACQHTTCSDCVGEGGCWWHTDSKTCTDGMNGCTEGSNCVNNVNFPCPAS